jgi:hypothetical protein
MRTLLTPLFLVACAAAPLSAQEVVGINPSGDVWHIDLDTGEYRLVENCGYTGLHCMAKGRDGTLYTMSGGEVLTLDPSSGRAASILSTSLKSVRALACNAGNILYAIESDPITERDSI